MFRRTVLKLQHRFFWGVWTLMSPTPGLVQIEDQRKKEALLPWKPSKYFKFQSSRNRCKEYEFAYINRFIWSIYVRESLVKVVDMVPIEFQSMKFSWAPALYLIISLIQQGFDVPLGNLALHWKNPIQWSFKSIVILWWVMAFMVQKTSQYICERVLRWSAWIRSSLDFSMFPCWRSGILDLRGPRGAAKNHDLEPPFCIGMYVPKWWTIDGKWKSAWAARQNLKKTREIIAISYLIFRKSASLFA